MRAMVGTVTTALQVLTCVWALRVALCCTIYEFNGSGFAANAFAIAHMVPIFHNTNGTFFLDNTNNYYKCSEDGGWHDFFAWEDQLVPWTAEKEAQEPDAPCVRHDISTVNKVVFEDLKLTWDELDFIGVKKVRRCAIFCRFKGQGTAAGLGRMRACIKAVSGCLWLRRHGSISRGSRKPLTSGWTSWRTCLRRPSASMSGGRRPSSALRKLPQDAFAKPGLAWCRGGDKLAEDKLLVSRSWGPAWLTNSPLLFSASGFRPTCSQQATLLLAGAGPAHHGGGRAHPEV